MGKYLRKAKITGEVAVVEVSAQSALGVRTRARSLALQRLQSPSLADPSPDSASYLQLRSRRLEKAPPLASPRGGRGVCDAGACGSGEVSLKAPNSRSVGSSVPMSGGYSRDEGGAEVSPGDWERDDRETTPCSLIYISENINTPGSTNRHSSSRRIQNVGSLSIPNINEMDEFFSGAEQLQQRTFSEKYNYDPVNDCPLPGRYEWVRLDYQ